VLSRVNGNSFEVCKITSVDHSGRPGYHPLPPAVSGLTRMSFIRVNPTTALPAKSFRRLVSNCDLAMYGWAVSHSGSSRSAA
jgi:hypothetical protein